MLQAVKSVDRRYRLVFQDCLDGIQFGQRIDAIRRGSNGDASQRVRLIRQSLPLVPTQDIVQLIQGFGRLEPGWIRWPFAALCHAGGVGHGLLSADDA